MHNVEIEKAKPHVMLELVDYPSDSVGIKVILLKNTGNITLMAFGSDIMSIEKTSPFDTFIQALEGSGAVVIDKCSHSLQNGQGIVIPAHRSYYIQPAERFKVMVATIKCGYENIV